MSKDNGAVKGEPENAEEQLERDDTAAAASSRGDKKGGPGDSREGEGGVCVHIALLVQKSRLWEYLHVCTFPGWLGRRHVGLVLRQGGKFAEGGINKGNVR